MTNRRKFLIGLGALASGSAAGLGTGAFTSATIPDRSVDVSLNDDENSQIALVPGDDPDVRIADSGANKHELVLDLSGANGEGVNLNSIYEWGDPDNPTDEHAFKMVNNDESGQSYSVEMTYDYDRSWVSGGASWNPSFQSYIQFEVFDADGHFAGRPQWARAQEWPDQGQYGSRGSDSPLSLGDGAAENRALNSGEEWYFIVRVDTTGQHASINDDVSGSATFNLEEF